MDILNDLKERKIFKEITNIEKFKKIKKGDGVYIGFDPTAESLHLGNYIQIAVLLRFKKAGFKTIAIIGGATGMIGDPSGKFKERSLLEEKTLIKNKNKIKKQLEKFGLQVIDNSTFYKNIGILDFLRNVGKHININYMINKGVISSRLESGISFTEFAYQLIQANDFYNLYKNHKVKIQVGGSDQWGNITIGIELIGKKIDGKNHAVGIITNLLTTKSGIKFGKSEENAIWLDRSMTSPYVLYQYLLNTSDNDLETLFNWITFLNQKEIKEILDQHNQEKFKKYGQKMLGKIVLKHVHSNKDFNEAIKITNALFGQDKIKNLTLDQVLSLKNSIPTTYKIEKDIQNLLVNNKIVNSRREAREAILKYSIEINGQKIVDPNLKYNNLLFNEKAIIIKKGKRNFYLVIKKQA